MSLAYIEEMLTRHHVHHERKSDGTIVWPYASKYPPRHYPILISEGPQDLTNADVYFPCMLPSKPEELCKEIYRWLDDGLGIGYDGPPKSGFYLRACFKTDYTEAAIAQLVCVCDSFLPLYERMLFGEECVASTVLLAFASNDSFGHS